MENIRTLFDSQQPAGQPVLPEDLRVLYGGDFHLAATGNGRPFVIGNFVSTADGVVSYDIPGKSSGSEISGADEADRLIMGLLRASADAVIVGSRTLYAAGRSHLWTAEYIYPPVRESYTRYRRDILHKPQPPLTVIVTASGKIDLNRAAFRTPGMRALILTTANGEDRLTTTGARTLQSTEVRVIEAAGPVLPAAAMLELLWREYNVRCLLHEGGPALFGSFVAQRLADEFFLTVAPQLAGRDREGRRPGMIAGVQFLPHTAPWLNLVSVKQCRDYLYLRYRDREPSRQYWSC